jgi:hypothetical protein
MILLIFNRWIRKADDPCNDPSVRQNEQFSERLIEETDK